MPCWCGTWVNVKWRYIFRGKRLERTDWFAASNSANKTMVEDVQRSPTTEWTLTSRGEERKEKRKEKRKDKERTCRRRARQDWEGCKERLEERCESILTHLLSFNLVQPWKSFKILTVKRLNFTYFMTDFRRLWHRWAHCLQMTASGAHSHIKLSELVYSWPTAICEQPPVCSSVCVPIHRFPCI